MNNILLVFGGNSVEHEISIITSLQLKNKYKGKYNLLLCYLKDNQFYFVDEKAKLLDFINYKKFKKINFIANSNYIKVGLKKYNFESVLITAHGMNCEDGQLVAFFKTLNIDVIGENIYSGTIGQDKVLSKELCKVNILPYIEINRQKLFFNTKDILKKANELKYPLMLKPSKLGSSVGICVVNNNDELLEKIEQLLCLTHHGAYML